MEVTEGYKQTDAGVIPEDWNVYPTIRMGEVHAGKALAVNGAGSARPYLRTKNVFDGRIDLTDVLYMPMTDVEFARFRLRPCDVLLNEGQSLELVGRCSIYSGEHQEPCAIQNQLVRFRARDGVSAEFAAHLFRSCQQNGVFAKIAMQTTSVAHLGVSRFQRLQLLWPTLAEQEAIAEALSDADALIESLEQLIAKKRLIKQGAMQELLTGKNRLPGFSGEWEVESLGEIALASKGIQLSSYDMVEQGKFLHLNGGIAPSGHTDEFNTPANSITISEGGNSCGHVQFMTEPFWCGGHCYVVTPKRMDNYFLYHALKTNQSAIMALRVGSGLPNVQKTALLAFKLRYPVAHTEQAAIAAILSDMDAEIEALEAKLTKARQIKQGMMHNLLTGRIRLV